MLPLWPVKSLKAFIEQMLLTSYLVDVSVVGWEGSWEKAMPRTPDQKFVMIKEPQHRSNTHMRGKSGRWQSTLSAIWSQGIVLSQKSNVLTI